MSIFHDDFVKVRLRLVVRLKSYKHFGPSGNIIDYARRQRLESVIRL